MAAWQYDLFLIAPASVDEATLISALQGVLPAADSPSPNLKMWGTPDGNRIDFWTGSKPAELLVRIDLREPSEAFQTAILSLVTALGLQMRNGDDVQLEATAQALQADIDGSPARQFLDNPPADEEDEDEDQDDESDD